MSFRRAILVIAGLSLLGPCAYAAQQDQPSVAEAARKARAEKKNLPKPAKVYTDDNIGDVPGHVSVVGGGASAAPAPSGEQSSGNGSQSEVAWKAKFSAARKKLADDKKDLDLLQREYNLKQTQYYSDPNQAMRQQYSMDELNAMKDKIDKRTEDIAKDQQAIEDLEDQLRQSGGDPGWAREEDQSSEQEPSESQPQENEQQSQTPPPASQEQSSQPQAQPSGQDQGSAPQSQSPPPSSPPQP
ncbi:MAG TPA: hypothetical protein VEH50_01940 [Methylomirabilota bacterium]|jgi:hypothetical protein|nr:hypothetical protein [Methylomirabilota bacterium]